MKKKNEVRTIAVENFLMSLSGNRWADEMNLSADAESYGWNTATVEAIRKGIADYYAKS